ncbi:Crp/Fnr family transcriptional regulator [Seonamhaeicola marinus]|uniref:Crp/Fnr family transcriptional regulator n=1 Tax=Seonamhaeicola marinus TaxID=1912246 RepID=A0A5D0HJD4_9FLAO|nr:Crp/Fnr family transcriptional regulator [Seonamhaeicola marinus]TYA71365.1 Crp/Fnr family transcriptional regulator [Seonamhaeicola marinus]
MNTDNSISKEIFKDLSFSNEENGIINAVFFKEILRKGDQLIKTGDNVDVQYYVIEGCLRSYHIDAQGREFTVQFAIKDWWMSDYTAFFSSSKAIMNIEAIQDSVVYKITDLDKEFLYSNIPKIESFFRKKLERAFSAFQKRILSELSLTAKERYINFLKSYPDIEKSIKNYHIASFLGITTESLSRIRKEL